VAVVFQIIIPPFLVNSDRDVADQSLYENYISRMQSGIRSRSRKMCRSRGYLR